MKKNYYTLAALLLFMMTNTSVIQGQAFHKRALLISISEGSTAAQYTTSNTNSGSKPVTKSSSEMDGVRDPLMIEYGLCKRIGIGLTSGGDIFKVDSRAFYGFNTSDNKPLEVKTSEFTFDFNYHVYISKRLDCAAFASIGGFSVAYNTRIGENNFKYEANGGIVRVGTKVRYYFCKRLGVLGMLSSYSGNATPEKTAKIYEGQQDYSTSISGVAMEFGLCFRFF